MKRRLWKDKDGFTLVELIVVLVILGILIALLVPSLTGYIDKARKKAKLAECRQVVVAAQTQLSEIYGAAEGADVTTMGTMINKENVIDAILKLSEAPGKISGNILINDKAAVTYLVYEAKDGTQVIYEKGHDPEYRVDEDGEKYSEDAPGYRKWIDSLTDGSYDNTKDLQKLFKDQYGGLPEVNWDTVDIPEKFKNGVSTQYYWKPIVTKDNKVLLVADSKGSSQSNAMASIIYCDGKYYYNTNGNGTALQGNYIVDNQSKTLDEILAGGSWHAPDK